MKKIFKDLKQYFPFIIYSTKSKLKSEVAGSYLNSLWWVINPLCMMLIYMFVVVVVFKSREPNFPIFVFIGLTLWDFFNRVVSSSAKLVKSNRNIINKVYIPKYILLIVNTFVMLFKFFISLAIVFIFMIIFKIHVSFKILYFIPILIVLYLLTFGISLIIMHFGVYIADLHNVINIILKFVFYFSGVFYNLLLRVPCPYNKILLIFNPMATLINESRNVLINNMTPNLLLIFGWFIISIILNIIGFKLLKKYENSYSKVI